MEKFFEFEKIRYPQRVRFASTKFRSHASLWWDKLQLDRECGGREKIKSWDRMLAKMKCKKFPVLCFELRRLQNLKHFKMSVKEYMEEFCKPCIKFGQNEGSSKSIAKNVNGLSFALQDEFNVLNFHAMA